MMSHASTFATMCCACAAAPGSLAKWVALLYAAVSGALLRSTGSLLRLARCLLSFMLPCAVTALRRLGLARCLVWLGPRL